MEKKELPSPYDNWNMLEAMYKTFAIPLEGEFQDARAALRKMSNKTRLLIAAGLIAGGLGVAKFYHWAWNGGLTLNGKHGTEQVPYQKVEE